MKVKFSFQNWDDDSYPQARSDLYCIGVDCIDLLLSPVRRLDYAKQLLDSLRVDEVKWWYNCSRVEGEGDKLKIYTDISYNDEHAVIDRETLKQVVCDWIRFLETRETSEHEY